MFSLFVYSSAYNHFYLLSIVLVQIHSSHKPSTWEGANDSQLSIRIVQALSVFPNVVLSLLFQVGTIF